MKHRLSVDRARGAGAGVAALGALSAVALAATTLVVLPATASAATWGGTSTGGYPGENAVFPNVTALFKLDNQGRVTVRNAQFLMVCVDRGDGTQSVRAFTATAPRVPLRLNRFTTTFTVTSDGRQGTGTVTGRMRPNGRGSAAITMSAVGRDSGTGGIIEDCEAEVTYALTRISRRNPPPGLPPELRGE